ncbi:hypothetical protein ACFL2V_09500 [Pseudomonadota bacterium]
MLGFIKNMFGGSNAAEPQRKLKHPRDLKAGDIIKFAFLDNQDLSGKQFEVTQINSYLYDGLNYPELILKDSQGNIVYLMMEEEDGEECVAISKKVARSKIRKVIDQADLDKILEKGTGTSINVASVPDELEGWLVKTYTETDDAVKGAFAKGDTRDPSHNGGGRESFSSHTLVDDSDEYALEIEVYGTNELELSATVYLEVSDIDEMWPGTAAQ